MGIPRLSALLLAVLTVPWLAVGRTARADPAAPARDAAAPLPAPTATAVPETPASSPVTTESPSPESSATTGAPATTASPTTAPATQTRPATGASDSEPGVASSIAAPHRHQGFYLRIGSGSGFMSAFGDAPQGGSASISGLGSLASVAIGGSPTPGFVIAGVFIGSMTTGHFNGGPFEQAQVARPATPTTLPMPTSASGDALASFAELGVLVDWFPNPSGGWHVGASLGLGVVGVQNHADESRFGYATGAGTIFGGYDWWIGPAWSLGWSLVGLGALPGNLKDSSNNDSGYRLTPLAIALQGSILFY